MSDLETFEFDSMGILMDALSDLNKRLGEPQGDTWFEDLKERIDMLMLAFEECVKAHRQAIEISKEWKGLIEMIGDDLDDLHDRLEDDGK